MQAIPLTDSIRQLQAEIAAWADTVFPGRTVHDIMHKLACEELPEFLLNPVAEEIADVLLLILDAAHVLKVDAQEAVRRKIEINRARRWAKTEAGTIHHVKE